MLAPRTIVLDIPALSQTQAAKVDKAYLEDEIDEFDMDFKISVTKATFTEQIKQDALEAIVELQRVKKPRCEQNKA